MLQVRNQQAIDIGAILSEIKSGKLWKKEIGDGIESWAQFLAQPEVGMSEGEAEQFINLYKLTEVFGLESVTAIPPRTARLLAKMKVDGDMISDAGTLAHRDFKERYYEKGKEEGKTYQFVVMRRCNETGSLTKIPIESAEVEQVFKEKLHG